LEKPGRDPRPAFHQAKLREGVEQISHLALGMVLEGTVTNVTAFGAFVRYSRLYEAENQTRPTTHG
jgi:uncharacterized protein